jgi:hypothetical protein
VDTAGCILQGDVRTKIKTPGTVKNMVEEVVQTSTMERLCKLHYILVQGSCLVFNTRSLGMRQPQPEAEGPKVPLLLQGHCLSLKQKNGFRCPSAVATDNTPT